MLANHFASLLLYVVIIIIEKNKKTKYGIVLFNWQGATKTPHIVRVRVTVQGFLARYVTSEMFYEPERRN